MHRNMQIALLVISPVVLVLGLLVATHMLVPPSKGDDYVQRIELPQADGQVGLPEVLGPPDPDRPLVVIDAGHGGRDPGAVGSGMREKDITLALAQAIRDELLAKGGVRVALTRDDDRYLLLAERSDIARRLGADLFISVHADSAENASASGASVYVLSEKGSSEAAAKYAAKENQADALHGVSLDDRSDAVSAILVDLSQREAQAGASEMASLVLRELRGRMRLHNPTVQSAAFGVLKAPDVPSILFETGYISNAGDAQFLSSEQGEQTISQAAAQAIRVFFARQADL